MPADPSPIYFENTAGHVLVHSTGYAVLRYRAGRRQPGDLAGLLTQLGQLLLRHGWHRFLADNRLMAPLNEAEKTWFINQWLGQGVPRPVPLYGAIVLPMEVVARLSISQMLSEANSATMVYRSFVEQNQAEAYLAGLPLR